MGVVVVNVVDPDVEEVTYVVVGVVVVNVVVPDVDSAAVVPLVVEVTAVEYSVVL